MSALQPPGEPFTPTGRLHLGVTVPGPADELDFAQLRTIAHTAERGHFTSLTLDERYWQTGDPGEPGDRETAGRSDVITLLAALAAETTTLGLLAALTPAAPAEEAAPGDADTARRIADLNTLSGGRAGWLPLTEQPDALDVPGLRAAWAGRAAQRHRAEEPRPVGSFARDGRHFALGLAPAETAVPAPVLILPGFTAAQRAAGAAHADVLRTPPASLEAALAVRGQVTAAAHAAGRAPGHVKISQAATVIVAATSAAAHETANRLREHLPEDAWDQLALIGSGAEVAEDLLHFARTGAVDAVELTPWLFPEELANVVNYLVPELLRRGLLPDSPPGAGPLPVRSVLALPRTTPPEAAPPELEVADLAELALELRLALTVRKVAS